MRRLMTCTALILILATTIGCNLFKQDPKVADAKEEVDAAIAEAKETRDAHARGDATDEQLSAALRKVDAEIAEYEAIVAEVATKHDDLGSWGATIGGMFGPQGVAIGGTIGTIAAGLWGWITTRKFRGLIAGYQAARTDLHASKPEAGAVMDEFLRKHIPTGTQGDIRKLKKKGVIAELPAKAA